MVYQKPDKELEKDIEITPDELSEELDEDGLSFEEDPEVSVPDMEELEKAKSKGRQVNRHALEIRRKIEERQELLRLRDQFGDLFDELQLLDEEEVKAVKRPKKRGKT
jgi:hypothetical protein